MSKKNVKSATPARCPVRELLRAEPGLVNLAGYDTATTTGSPGSKAKAAAELAKRTAPDLAEQQERLYAESTAGGSRRVLLVLQGMDTSGKGGVIEHVVGQLGPAGVTVTSFKQPTPQELAHHFLWRIRRALPAPGQVAVFDRSHYEDVLVVRVHGAIDEAQAETRFDEINRFEADLVASGTTLVKCFLNVSFAEQRARLLARLEDPAKHWKFREADIAERALWPDYMSAYARVLARTSTDAAPWYVVPADHKWYRNWAISHLLLETLTELDPRYPQSDLDVPALEERLQPPH
ncbi:MAG: polyphosphate kinase 2 family protein [Actinomycetota bacterium]|nr:polyphosphate kinase 2 family protein [Actinomycetota bacterium]